MIQGRNRKARGILMGAACGLATLFASAPAAAAAADTQAERPFLGGFLQESRILYPLTIGPWVARDEHLYEQAEAGASVRYQHGDLRDRWIDVYFYPAGVVPDERDTSASLLARADAALYEAKAMGRNTLRLAPGDLHRSDARVGDASQMLSR